MIADGEFHSQSELSDALGVPEKALWEALHFFVACGLKIITEQDKGVRSTRVLDLLERRSLLAELRILGVPDIYRLEIFTTIASSNQYLLEGAGRYKLSEIDRSARVALAEYQTQGRGRHGRSWLSPIASGINLSIGWHFEQPLTPPALICLSLALGSSVIKALSKIGIADLGLKWPNDIIFQGKKLGGLLIESKQKPGQQYDIVLGLGLNVNCPADFIDSVGQACIDLASIKQSIPTRNYIAAGLISEFIKLLDHYMDIKLSSIIDEWRRYDCMSGKKATLIANDQDVNGLVLGIDNNGALLMCVNGNIEKYTAGVIKLRIQHGSAY